MIRVGFCSNQVGCWYIGNELNIRKDVKASPYFLITMSTSKLHQEKIISDSCSFDCPFLLQRLPAEDKSLHFRVMSVGEMRAACCEVRASTGHSSPALAGESSTAHLEPFSTAQFPKRKKGSTQRPKLSRALLSLSALAHVWRCTGERCESCSLLLLCCWAQ